MKRLSLLLTFCIALTAGSIAGTTNTTGTGGSAVEYMSEVLGPLGDFKRETWQYLKAVTRGKRAKKVEKKRENLIEEIGKVKKQVSKAGDYEGDASLRNAVVEYLDLTYTVLKQDYDKILDMEEIAEQSYDAMEAYLLAQEKASEKLNDASDKLSEAEKTFAETHGVNLVEGESDKMTEKIRKSSQTLSYYNDIYLIFFKVYKQEAYVLEAQSRGDVAAMEQNNSTLSSFAEEALDQLRELEPYEGDKSLIMAATKITKFYQEEADEDFAKIIDFYIAKDNFDKIKAALEAKKERDRTQQDIDKFNEAAETYNEAVNEYNKVNQGLNEKRSRYLEDWNSKVEAFFDNHSK